MCWGAVYCSSRIIFVTSSNFEIQTYEIESIFLNHAVFSDLVLLSNEKFWAISCTNNGQNALCFRNKNCLTSKETDIPTEIGTFRAQGSSPRTLPDCEITVTQLTVHQVRCCLACGLCYSDRANLQNIRYIPYCCGCQPNGTLECEIWGSCSGTNEIQRPLGCDAASLCKQFWLFWRCVQPSCTGWGSSRRLRTTSQPSRTWETARPMAKYHIP